VLEQLLGPLGIIDPCVELPDLSFRQMTPFATCAVLVSDEITNLAQCEARVLAEADKRHVFCARGVIAASTVDPLSWPNEAKPFVVAESRVRRPGAAGELTDPE
jgi:hypothetical protein